MPLTVYPSVNDPRKVKGVWIFFQGAWKEVKALFVFYGGLWRKIYENLVVIDINFTAPDQNLRSIYTQITGDSSGNPVTVTFNLKAGYTMYASSTSTYGLTVGNWPATSNVTLNVEAGARIVGAGGAAGYVNIPSRGTITGISGGAGGPALRVNYNTFTLINNGTVAGGGGGGGPCGAGCSACYFACCSIRWLNGGVGAGNSAAGAGQSGCSSKSCCGGGRTSCGKAGDGGSVGSPGQNGSNGTGGVSNTAGGAAGVAIVYG